MERLIINKSKRDFIIESFDMDNEMPLTFEDDVKEYTIYLTVQEVYSVVKFMQEQLLQLEKVAK